MDIIEKIANRNSKVTSQRKQPPEHDPEMLYIGCLDARLNINSDVGIPDGKALILRNVGALIPSHKGNDELAHDVSIGAALEFYLNRIPEKSGRIKHIVVAGHTDCGGIKACHQGCGSKNHDLPLHLGTLHDIRYEVQKRAESNNWSDNESLRELEKESVRQSVANLMSYPVVKKAVEDGKVEIHGWLINTASKRISEMNPETKEFSPISQNRI